MRLFFVNMCEKCPGVEYEYDFDFYIDFVQFLRDIILSQTVYFYIQVLVFNYCITMKPGKFELRYSRELLKHMDKQNEVLMEAYRSMFNELQKLQVEEEMFMRKLYEVMSEINASLDNVGVKQLSKKVNTNMRLEDGAATN
ncbi:uncharacterized protein LOC131620290 isoform X2 [Vicia villosa]|uniref:uncharacterized protein LOC131620290 isoform X2 n=1 Tax=Vicia villosa TaxID=3911 RepID=UPI00273CA0AE|nr:uncharacterized protein LOC131620290 isoform X2 [Vicia villosa]